MHNIFHKKYIFKRGIKRCIYNSPSIQSFEEEWRRLMSEYNLENKEWLQGLYRIRESWIPIYNRSTFFAGMIKLKEVRALIHFLILL
jgi:zinc finger SWIM domain-containing protein 3